MKKLIIIPFLLFFSLLLSAETYWITPRGNDSNAGTDSSSTGAWLTWAKGLSSASAGDTVFFRGGVYPQSVSGGAGITNVNDGAAGNLIYYWAYSDEVPILDCGNITPTGTSHRAINAGISYCHFKGLTIRNVRQINTGVEVVALRTTSISNVTFENFTIHHVDGVGFQPWNPVNVTYLNCDAYSCCDSLGIGETGYNPGGRGTGFGMVTQVSEASTVYYRYCRAWKCSDQGFSMLSIGYVEVDGCWSFLNGSLGGLGHGYKYSFNITSSIALNRKIVNSIAAYNEYSGFTSNDNTYKAIPMVLYNNTAYKNGTGSAQGWGFIVYNTGSSDELELLRVHKNNISYANTKAATLIGTNALYTHSNNTWDASPAVTVSDADFVSVDSTGLTGARGADGSLPVLDFLHLAEGSDLIGAGIGVGLVYDGDGNLWSQSTPSLGAYEYSASEPPEPPDYPEVSGVTPAKTSATSITTGGTAINDGMGTISMKGVCWSTSINPTISDSRTWDGSGTDDYTSTITGLKLNTTYYVRSYITNETGTTYGESYEVVTPAVSVMKGTKVFVKDGKILVID